jgi:hypothetical protein
MSTTFYKPTLHKLPASRQLAVDFKSNPWDRQAEAMLKAGFTRRYTCKVTGLRPGQLQWRARCLNWSTRKHRNGETPEALDLLARINAAIGLARDTVRRLNGHARRFSSRPKATAEK